MAKLGRHRPHKPTMRGFESRSRNEGWQRARTGRTAKRCAPHSLVAQMAERLAVNQGSSEVRVLPGERKQWGCSSVGQSTRLSTWGSPVQVRSLSRHQTPPRRKGGGTGRRSNRHRVSTGPDSDGARPAAAPPGRLAQQARPLPRHGRGRWFDPNRAHDGGGRVTRPPSLAPIVQRIGHRTTDPGMGVRVLLGARDDQ